MKTVCNIDNMNIDRILHLDIKAGSKKDTNTAILLTTSYIATVWFNRDTGTQIQPSLYKSCITRHRSILSMILKQKMKDLFSVNYCNFDTFWNYHLMFIKYLFALSMILKILGNVLIDSKSNFNPVKCFIIGFI